MFELAICTLVRWRSDLMASGMRGGKANHDRNATKKPTRGGQPWRAENLEELTPTEMERAGVRVPEIEQRECVALLVQRVDDRLRPQVRPFKWWRAAGRGKCGGNRWVWGQTGHGCSWEANREGTILG